MAKALGLIGNFKGKLGNTVGYSLKDSNNKQTQGVRVYQPVVRNPKTAAQAEQRAKLAPINATYRAIKMIIDRGQEGKAYGNKSRLAWLKDALKAFDGGWFPKGASVIVPAWVPITKGSLVGLEIDELGNEYCKITAAGISSETEFSNLGEFSTLFESKFPALKDGDQITFVALSLTNGVLGAKIDSIVLNSTSTEQMPITVTPMTNAFNFEGFASSIASAVIVSREGDNGAHLRSTASFAVSDDIDKEYNEAADKQAAIESYMSQGANTDWAEESLM